MSRSGAMGSSSGVALLTAADMADERARTASTFALLPPKVSDLATPFVIPHRGAGSMVAPENTLEAFKIGMSYGLGVTDGGDWRVTSDGALVSSHDATLDRVTSLTGPTTNLTSQRAQDTIVDAGTWFGGGFGDLRMMSAEEYFSLVGNAVVTCPEPKETAAVAPLVSLLTRLGLKRSAIINSFDTNYLAPFAAAGFTDVLLNVVTPPSAGNLTAWAAAGITWIGIPLTFTAPQVQAIIGAGFKVMAGTVLRLSDFPAAYAGLDIKAWAADDPLWFRQAIDVTGAAKIRRSSDPFANQRYYHGHISWQNSVDPVGRGGFLGTNRWGFQGPVAGANAWAMQGWDLPADPTTYTRTYYQWYDAPGSDATRWLGRFFGATTDTNYHDVASATENGYQVWLRLNGSHNLVAKTAGVGGTTQTSATSTAFSAPLVLSSALTIGAAITALPVNATATALAAGAKFALPNGQVATVSAATGAGATSVPITSLTPAAAPGYTSTIPAGASLPQGALLTEVVTPTTVTFGRLDTAPVLSGALTSGAAITSLPVAAVTNALASGTKLLLPTGQLATTSGVTAVGATSITVASVTPSAAVPSGTALPVAVQLTDAAFRGPYSFCGRHDNAGTSGLQGSWSQMVRT